MSDLEVVALVCGVLVFSAGVLVGWFWGRVSIAQAAVLTAQLARITAAVTGCLSSIASITSTINTAIATQQAAQGCH